MSRTAILTIVAALSCCSVARTASAQEAKLQATLDAKVKRIDAAFVQGDLTPVFDLLSPEMMITNPVGAFISRNDIAGAVKSGTLKYTSAVVSEEKVAQFGDVAVLTYLSTEAGTMQGQDISGKYRYTGVWARQNGDWKLVAVQITQVLPRS